MDIACPTCAASYEIDATSVAEAGRKVRCAACGTIWRAFRDRPSEVISAPPPPEPVLVADPPPMAPAVEDIAATPDLPSPATYEQFAGPAEIDPAEVQAQPSEHDGASAVGADEPPAKRGARLTRAKAPKGPGPGARMRKLVSWPVLFVLLTLGLCATAFAQRERVVRIVPQSAAIFATFGAPVNLRGIEIRNVKSRMVDDNGVSVLVIDGDLVSLAKERVTIPRLRFAVVGSQGQELYVWSAQADRPALSPGETLNFRRRLAAPPNEGRDVSVRFLAASDITAGLK
jgi:predicted Zn finger-like uncharacterized protein